MNSKYLTSFTKGIFRENPLLRLLAGICPAIAVSTSVVNGTFMGLAVTAVLLFSNVIASALKNVIPQKIKIPAYLIIIAFFVSLEQLFFNKFFPEIENEFGIFLPLVAVNCIILGSAQSIAEKNTVLISAIDGIGTGFGYTAVLFIIGAVREIFGKGTILSGIDTTLGAYIDLGTFKGFDFSYELETIGLSPLTVFILPAGGFFVFGMMLAAINILSERKNKQTADIVEEAAETEKDAEVETETDIQEVNETTDTEEAAEKTAVEEKITEEERKEEKEVTEEKNAAVTEEPSGKDTEIKSSGNVEDITENASNIDDADITDNEKKSSSEKEKGNATDITEKAEPEKKEENPAEKTFRKKCRLSPQGAFQRQKAEKTKASRLFRLTCLNPCPMLFPTL